MKIYLQKRVSRVRHCVLVRTRFPFGRIECGTKGPTGCRKKFECLCKLQTPGKTCKQRISEGKLNIPISHNGEMFEFHYFRIYSM